LQGDNKLKKTKENKGKQADILALIPTVLAIEADAAIVAFDSGDKATVAIHAPYERIIDYVAHIFVSTSLDEDKSVPLEKIGKDLNEAVARILKERQNQ